MLILAGDTSNTACSCCLMEDDHVIAESFLSVGLTHSETFMPMIHDMMQTAGRRYGELDAFACSIGPGSFTGIRIGVSAMKTMAMVANKPIVPVSSLLALSLPYRAQTKTPVAALINARNRRVFAAAYDKDTETIREAALSIEDFARACRENFGPRELILCGDAADLYADDAVFAEFTICRTGVRGREIHASCVAEIARRSLVESASSSDSLPREVWEQAFSPDALLPVYRVKTAAERALLKGESIT